MELIKKYKQGNLTTNDVRRLNYIVLCLMISAAATSIVWSLSMHVLSGDFYNGFIGAKFVFRERDLTQMEKLEQDIWKHDLERVLNESYTIETSNQITPHALVMPKLIEVEPSTQKPKIVKIAHVFQVKNSNVPDSPTISNSCGEEETTTKVPKPFNISEDRKFLSLMTIDIHQTRWPHSFTVKFIYSFPFFSEIIAIIWTAMCFIFQSGVKKTWGLPKPWRIVIPSIIMFSIMSFASLSYVILSDGFLQTFCTDLRANLSRPEVISCGDAMAVLRPLIRSQALSHNTYLKLFRISYILALLLWSCALIIMLLRFVLAIDFQLVDVETNYDREMREGKLNGHELVEVQLSSPKSVKLPETINAIDEKPKSEDDFQSAKSHLSEVATPLLNQVVTTTAETKT